VRDWLRAYVLLVTGQSAEQWSGGKADPVETHVANTVPCRQIAGLFAPPAVAIKPPDPWGVQLVGSSSDAMALAAYRRLQEKYASILGGLEPRVVHHGLGVRVGAESRTSAEKLCANLRAAGASCEVQRN
jgi:SPOR domain